MHCSSWSRSCDSVAMRWSSSLRHSRDSRAQSARARVGQFGECLRDPFQAEADALAAADEGDPAQHVAPEQPLVASAALGADQAALLVEVQRRDGDAAALGDDTDGEQVGHA